MRIRSTLQPIAVTLLLCASFGAPITGAQSGDETITVNHVVLVDTPPHPEWEWNYSYQTEVDDLQIGVDYIAIILIKEIGNDDWGGLDWWWDDIEGDGDQYNYTFSLQQGCYYIKASLYESSDLNADEENATVWAFDHLDFTVGNADCDDGGDDYECLTFANVTNDYNYSAPPQYSFNITADLVNHCPDGLIYPSTLLLNDTAGIHTSTDDVNWRYGVGGNNSSYQVTWEVTRDSTVVEGTLVTFEMHPTRDNCYVNCTESQNYSYNYTIPFGLVDLNACYTIDNVADDYNFEMDTFNVTAELNNSCWGGIHYPVGKLVDYNLAGVNASPDVGVEIYGAMAYMIFDNTSTTVHWSFSIDYNLTTGNATLDMSFQPNCWVYTASNLVANSYMQDCDLTAFDSVNHTILIGELSIPDNGTDNNTTPDDNSTVPDNGTDNNTTPDDNSTIPDNGTDNNTIPDNGTDGNMVKMNISWTAADGTTGDGVITIELYPDAAPHHVDNFKALVSEGYYDNTIFHRIIEDFMVQGGDFQTHNGYGGHAVIWAGYCNGQPASSSEDCSITEWTLPDEADNGLNHVPFVLSMAKTSAPNSGGSQFFIVSDGANPSHLDGVHTVFGKVIQGQSTVAAFNLVETGSYDKPIYDVTILYAWIVAENTSSSNSTDDETTDDSGTDDSTDTHISDSDDGRGISFVGVFGTVVALFIGAIFVRRDVCV